MKILILGGGLQGLSCGASLYNKGWIVDIVSDELLIVKSKFFRKVYSNDYNSIDESVFRILANEQYNVIIPMGDLNVSFLSKYKERIESEFGSKCACPANKLLSLVEDKHVFMEFCRDNEIPHPKTVTIDDDNIESAAKTVGFPSLIKPNYSVGARGITRVNSIDELTDKYPTIKEQYGDCTLQELIDNKEYYYNVMLYRNKEGRYLGYTIIKIVRMYPIEAGSSTCCISVENDELLNICKDCLEKLNWVGIADFDVLQRLDSREYKIIEINPRVPASLKASFISGVNFPEMIAVDEIGGGVPDYQYTPGKVMRYLGTDLMWFLKSNKRLKALPNWFCLAGKNIYYQDIYANDISTWWTWLGEGLIKLRRRNQRLR